MVDGMNTVVEQDAGGYFRYKYVYANGMLLSRIDNSSTKAYYHRDGLGTIIGTSNSTPAVASAQLFDEFGNWLYWDSNWDYYTYTGQEYDWPLTDAYNLRAREYYPEYGRFMQEDPIGNSGGSLNWYMYTRDNPINFIDPLGLNQCTPEEMQIESGMIKNITNAFYWSRSNNSSACATTTANLENYLDARLPHVSPGNPKKCCTMTDVGIWYSRSHMAGQHNWIKVECSSKCGDKEIYHLDPWLAAIVLTNNSIFGDDLYHSRGQPTGWWSW